MIFYFFMINEQIKNMKFYDKTSEFGNNITLILLI